MDRERYQRYLAGREWGLRREAVRKRCGGICERCRYFPMDHVHHLTYARIYNEALEDLQAICKGCHEFTHGKTDHDPRLDVPVVVRSRTVKTVYLAGKIRKGDWRDKLTRNDVEMMDTGSEVSQSLNSGRWPISWGAVVLEDGRRLDYTGPYFTGCDHGCTHALGHAFGEGECNGTESLTLDEVPGLCANAIRRSDLLYAWIDAPDCYGTIAEVGFAVALNIPVLIAGPRFYRDMWFVYGWAHLILIDQGGPIACFNKMVRGGWGYTLAEYRFECRDIYGGHGESMSHDPVDGHRCLPDYDEEEEPWDDDEWWDKQEEENPSNPVADDFVIATDCINPLLVVDEGWIEG